MNPRILRWLAVAGLSISGTACATKPDTWVELKGQRYIVEVADDNDERARGLMFREAMDADRGMLFVHPANEMQAYWMKNTQIPLDILYFDPQLKLVSASLNTPPCSGGDQCPPYPSTAPAQYVLELNAGEAQRLQLKDGDTMTVSPSITLKSQD